MKGAKALKAERDRRPWSKQLKPFYAKFDIDNIFLMVKSSAESICYLNECLRE
ncbi:MAG: hypothetical protein HC780_10685 [Leptolyngbyaceae cyanobacterium CSU_1_3]|nr:hypothetical protein [Leptolyngbyaceae cyanobacterium CSU_1_3]